MKSRWSSPPLVEGRQCKGSLVRPYIGCLAEVVEVVDGARLAASAAASQVFAHY